MAFMGSGAGVLVARNLTRSYGSLRAVDGVSLTLSAGEIVGLLGPNGAGKTTTVSMLAGITPPDGGEVLLRGESLASGRTEAKRNLGLVPQELALYEGLSAGENLRFFGALYGLGGRDLAEAVGRALRFVGLADRAGHRVKTFSGGMKRRLNLAMGLVHDPRLILLDEPTVGIDPQARHNILDVVRDIVRSGRTVLYTTHYLEEAEALCDRLAIIDHGRILAQGTVGELKAQVGEGSLLTVQGRFSAAALQGTVAPLSGLSPLEVADGRALLLVARDGPGVGHVLETLYRSDLQLDDVTIKEPNLEDLFLRLTGRELRD